MSTLENQRRILAQKIADRLFTNGDKETATRLVLKKGGMGCEIDLGGWCREAAVDQIERVLKEQQLPQ